MEINVLSLGFYNEKVSDWTVEKGVYFIYVENASNSISEKIEIAIK